MTGRASGTGGHTDPPTDSLPEPAGPDARIEDAVATLRRWEDAGAVWRVLAREGASITVGLWTCTGDELVDRVVSAEPALDRFVAGRTASDDLGELRSPGCGAPDSRTRRSPGTPH